MRAKAEQLQRVDVREWARRGLLRDEARFSWSWRCGDQAAGSVSVWVASPYALTLSYNVTQEGERRGQCQRVDLVQTACSYGGARQWFACPCCHKRVALLYLRWGRFGCRHCRRVAHASQSEDALDRALRKQSKIEALLADNWRRPKGMRRRTHDRYLYLLVGYAEQREAALEALVARLFGPDL